MSSRNILKHTIRASLCAVAVNAAAVPSRDFIRRRKAPNAPWLRCRPWAAKRNAVAARFTPLQNLTGLMPESLRGRFRQGLQRYLSTRQRRIRY